MANYREFISKRECLVNAVLWSVIPALQIGLLLFFLIDSAETCSGGM